LLPCSGDVFTARASRAASRRVRDVCNRRHCSETVVDCCAPSVRGRSSVRVFAANSRGIEDACLTAPANPRGDAAWQDRPAAIPDVRILDEKSAPFPRQSQARVAVLCEMFISCVWLSGSCYVSPSTGVKQSREKQSINPDARWSCISWRSLACLDRDGAAVWQTVGQDPAYVQREVCDHKRMPVVWSSIQEGVIMIRVYGGTVIWVQLKVET
jgi:hypothetical protein